jgi:hypothetical protein
MRLRLDDNPGFRPNLPELPVANRRYECQSAQPASEILSDAPLERSTTASPPRAGLRLRSLR